MQSILRRFKKWFRRRRYEEGKTLSRFIARDVRRDVLIVSAAQIDEGIVVARVWTTNVLYVARGLTSTPEFEPEREIHVNELWNWTGKSWGGMPDGSSLGDRQDDVDRSEMGR